MRIDQAGTFGVLVNQLLAHGYAMGALKAADPDAIVGIASTGLLCYPETGADIGAARAATFAMSDDDWTFTHHWLLDPICMGRFPEAEGTNLGGLVKTVSEADMAQSGFGAEDPGNIVAEDRAVFLEFRGIGGYFTKLRAADYSKFDMGKVYMFILLAILPVLVVYICLSKHIIKGVTASSVRG